MYLITFDMMIEGLVRWVYGTIYKRNDAPDEHGYGKGAERMRLKRMD